MYVIKNVGMYISDNPLCRVCGTEGEDYSKFTQSGTLTDMVSISLKLSLIE